MSSGIPPGSGGQPAPVTSTGDSGSVETAAGTRNGTSVTEVRNPPRRLGALPPDQTSGRRVHERSASLPATPPANRLSESTPAAPVGKTDNVETPQEKQKKEVEAARQARENSSVEELEAEQEALLKEAGEKYEKVEEYTVLGKALAALKNPSRFGKDVKVILRLPGEDKPISLVPPDKKALKGRNVEELTKLAEDLLKQYNNTVFSGFNKEAFNQRISTIRDMLSDIVSKMAEKNKSKSGSNWQKRLEDMQHKRSIIHVKQPAPVEGSDGVTPELTVERLDEKATEQLMKDLEIIRPFPKKFLHKIKWYLDHGIQWKK